MTRKEIFKSLVLIAPTTIWLKKKVKLSHQSLLALNMFYLTSLEYDGYFSPEMVQMCIGISVLFKSHLWFNLRQFLEKGWIEKVKVKLTYNGTNFKVVYVFTDKGDEIISLISCYIDNRIIRYDKAADKYRKYKVSIAKSQK